MRILFVIGSLELGGAETHLTQIAIRLKRCGWDPEIFVFTSGGPLSRSLEDVGIPIFGGHPSGLSSVLPSACLRSWIGLVWTALSLICLMLSRRPSVVHFFLPTAYVLGGMAAILTFTRPRVMSRRSMNHYQASHPLMARLEHWLHLHMDRVCGNSSAVMKQLAVEGVPSNRLRLIYNGVDDERSVIASQRPSVRKSLSISPAALVLIMIANLIPYKGHKDLLDALRLICRKLPDGWVCLLVGRDDGIGNALKAYGDSLELAPHLKWLGSRMDVTDLLSAADVGLLCSHEEGFSNAVLECMAAGLPVVVTDVGGNAEAVVDGITGRVVAPRDPAKLADGILSVSMNPDRQLMGLRGRQRVEELFSMTACVASYESLYKELLTSSSPN